MCGDPANLPYASAKTVGYETRIAELLAADMHAQLHSFWYSNMRGFVRNTLLARNCDVMVTAPAEFPRMQQGIAVTRPYYASSFVAIMRASDKRRFTSFDDAWLRDAKIGIELVGTDRSDIPPNVSLIYRGITQHITGFPMRSAQGMENPQGRIVDAVANGTVDVAFAWGPITGYFAKPYGPALRLETVRADPQHPDIHFAYALSMAVRKTDTSLLDRVQAAIDRHHAEIGAILAQYGVPRIPIEAAGPIPTGTDFAQAAHAPSPTH